MKITVETTVAAPLASIWRCYTNPDDIVQWNAASDDWHTTRATVDLRPGGDFSSRMELLDAPSGVTVRVTFDAEETHSIEQQRDGWQAILDRFRRHVEALG